MKLLIYVYKLVFSAIMTRLQEIAIKVGSLRDPNMTNSTAPPIGDDQRQHLENILESFKNRTNLDDSYTAKIQNFYPSCKYTFKICI